MHDHRASAGGGATQMNIKDVSIIQGGVKAITRDEEGMTSSHYPRRGESYQEGRGTDEQSSLGCPVSPRS